MDQKRLGSTLVHPRPWPSAFWCRPEPVKKHGPGAACAHHEAQIPTELHGPALTHGGERLVAFDRRHAPLVGQAFGLCVVPRLSLRDMTHRGRDRSMATLIADDP